MHDLFLAQKAPDDALGNEPMNADVRIRLRVGVPVLTYVVPQVLIYPVD